MYAVILIKSYPKSGISFGYLNTNPRFVTGSLKSVSGSNVNFSAVLTASSTFVLSFGSSTPVLFEFAGATFSWSSSVLSGAAVDVLSSKGLYPS